MNIRDQLNRDEGNVPYVYLDSEGYQTIGVGFMVDKRRGGGLRPEEIDFILRNRIRIKSEDLHEKFPWFQHLDSARAGVLVNMAYNLGVDGLAGFKKTLHLVESGQYEAASKEMLDSKWARQVGARSERLSEQMRTGVWV